MLAVDPAGISEFEGPQRDCAFGWLPGDEQLLSVLHTFGYRSPGPAGAHVAADLQRLDHLLAINAWMHRPPNSHGYAPLPDNATAYTACPAGLQAERSC